MKWFCLKVVRGKVTTRCLWHACKALGIGVLLMLLGACMATIGTYVNSVAIINLIWLRHRHACNGTVNPNQNNYNSDHWLMICVITPMTRSFQATTQISYPWRKRLGATWRSKWRMSREDSTWIISAMPAPLLWAWEVICFCFVLFFFIFFSFQFKIYF